MQFACHSLVSSEGMDNEVEASMSNMFSRNAIALASREKNGIP